MRDQQDHSVVTYWGGRPERYREFPRAAIRAHDTFGVQPVQFGHAFHYEAWVLERFAASTKSITHKPTTVSAVIDGVERSSKVTFVVTRRDDSVEYFLATKTEAATAASRLLRRIAAVNGAKVVHRTRTEIRARIDEFWWLERLRQVATIWVRKGADLDEPLVALITEKSRSLAELCLLLDAPRDLIRARLARLHIAGRLVVFREAGDMSATSAKGAAQ
ncbi:MAG: hypothetical protein H6933_11085 [Burkholderiaceae bacterium]|nr:hypothetical protein [Burkholderiaceae bacterium]